MATYRQAADPGAPRRSTLSYLAIGLVAGAIGTTLAVATADPLTNPVFGATYAQAAPSAGLSDGIGER